MHSEKLTALDAGFLEAEDADPHVSMAIGALAMLEGPCPQTEAFTATMAERIHQIPRCTQVLQAHGWDLEAPEWRKDEAFDVRHHVRRTAVPLPGDARALFGVVAEIMERRLERSRPLWECWMIDGLPDGQWAIVIKIHHCMADGISAGAPGSDPQSGQEIRCADAARRRLRTSLDAAQSDRFESRPLWIRPHAGNGFDGAGRHGRIWPAS